MAVADCLARKIRSAEPLARGSSKTCTAVLDMTSKETRALSVKTFRYFNRNSPTSHQGAFSELLSTPSSSTETSPRTTESSGGYYRSKAKPNNCASRTIQIAILVLLTMSIFPHQAVCTPSPESQKWQTLRPGLESITTSVSGEFLFSSSILAVRASPITFQPKVFRAVEFGAPTASAKRVCQASGASACINANFFDEQHRPLGTVISRGIIHKNIHRGGGTLTGIFVATKNSLSIKHRKSFITENVLEAFQAGPRLIAHGHPVSGIKASSAQGALSILCIDSEKRIILAKIALSIFARYPSKIQSTLLQKPFNCIDALNLDGGSSSQLFAWGEQTPAKLDSSKVIDSPGLDMVPVVFALVARP